MTDDWQVHQERDLPPEVWDFLKRERFFGLDHPEGVRRPRHVAVGQQRRRRQAGVALDAARDHRDGAQLARPGRAAHPLRHRRAEAALAAALADGREMPCFALTEPGAGSDAGAITATASSSAVRTAPLAAPVVEQALHHARRDRDRARPRVPAARPREPARQGPVPGITCALIPTSTPGRRARPPPRPDGRAVLQLPHLRPRRRGAARRDHHRRRRRRGRGWQMLMECLAAGRGISLPATAVGGAQLAARAVGAYAAVRQQFGLPIGRFEGIEEPLARIAGFTYLLEAARRYTAARSTRARSPRSSPRSRSTTHRAVAQIINDGMDVLGRRGDLARPAQPARARLHRHADLHHGRRRQHPDAHADDLRPGRDPLPPVCLPRDRRDRAQRRPRSTARSGRTSATCCGTACARCCSACRRGWLTWTPGAARRAEVLAPPQLGLGRVRAARRRRHGHARRRPQAQGEDHRPLRRLVLVDVPGQRHAAPLRSRRSPQARTCRCCAGRSSTRSPACRKLAKASTTTCACRASATRCACPGGLWARLTRSARARTMRPGPPRRAYAAAARQPARPPDPAHPRADRPDFGARPPRTRAAALHRCRTGAEEAQGRGAPGPPAQGQARAAARPGPEPGSSPRPNGSSYTPPRSPAARPSRSTASRWRNTCTTALRPRNWPSSGRLRRVLARVTRTRQSSKEKRAPRR
jgi:alkylation response protein AidB-like acyl-CoA dehydrogenase